MPLRAVVLGTLLAASLIVAPMAAADECVGQGCPAVTPVDHETIAVIGSTRETTMGNGDHGYSDIPGPHPPVVSYILDPQLRADPVSGRPCAFMGQTPGDPNSAAALAAETAAQRLIAQYGLCSNSPAAPPNQPTPGQAAAEAFEKHVPLPSPTMQIPPGYSITGTRAYLQIGGPQRLDPAPIAVFGYTVVLHVESSYDVDWGDGTVDRAKTSQGGRYPNGDLWHVYENTGTYTVTVTQHWTATYTINGTTGTIADVLLTTGVLQLPVTEAQAVVN